MVFEGCLELQVLVGVVNIHGYTVTSTHPPLPLFSPTTSPQVPIIVGLEPQSVDASYKSRPEVTSLFFSSSGVVFIPRNETRCLPGHVNVDLDYSDIEWLNSLSGVVIASVCVVWNLDDSPLVAGLQTIPNSGLSWRSSVSDDITMVTQTNCHVTKLFNHSGRDIRLYLQQRSQEYVVYICLQFVCVCV